MPSNRYREAFHEKYNLLGMATAAALSAATLNPLPLLVGVVAEAAYLVLVPDSHWYAVRLSKRDTEEEARQREQLKNEVLPTLRAQMKERYAHLEQMRRQIDTQDFSTQRWFSEVPRKLDSLLDKFLQFASKEVQFRNYLRQVLGEVRGMRPDAMYRDVDHESVTERRAVRLPGQARPQPVEGAPLDPTDRWVAETVHEVQAYYERQLIDIKRMMENEQDPNTRAVLEKRGEVLQRRGEYLAKIGKVLTNLNHQLRLLEDTFGLINDEIRARSPEQLLADIQDVVIQTDSMVKVLEEIAPYEQMVHRAGQTAA